MSRVPKVPLLPLLAALLAAPAALPAQDSAAANAKPTVAIMYFNNGAIGKTHADFEPLRGGIADLLITELSANPAIRVIERDRLEQLIREQDLGASGRVDKETAVRVGRLLGAQHMVFGGFVTDPRGTMRLDARAVNVETSEIVHVETVSDKQDNILAMIERLAEKMNRGMRLPAMPRRTADAAAPTKPPFQAVMLYSRAIAAENDGRKDEAVQLYEAVLAKFPDYAPAKKARERLAAPAPVTGN